MLRHAGKMDYSSVEETTPPYDPCFEETPVRVVKDLGRSPQSSSRSRVASKPTVGYATPIRDVRDQLENRLNTAISALRQALNLVDEFNDDSSTPVSPDMSAVFPCSDVSASEEDPDERKSIVLTSTEGKPLCVPRSTGKTLCSPKSNGAIHDVPTVTFVPANEFLPNQVKESEEKKSVYSVSEQLSTSYLSRTPRASQRTSATAEDSRWEQRTTPSSPKEHSSHLLSPTNISRRPKQRQIRRPEPVFADAVKMKEQVKEALRHDEYNVQNFYKRAGICQAIARNNWFENITLGVISFNTIWIAIDTDLNHEKSWATTHWVFIFAENFFCLYFFGEILIRYVAFRIKKNCLRDPWFVFDSALVIMMVGETWIMNLVLWITNSESSGGLENMSMFRLIRLLRMTRMLRMVRLMRAVPELMILLKGISAATRSVFFTLCLLALMIYIFAIAFTQMCEDTDFGNEYFPTVPASMNNLLLKGTLPDLAQFVEDAGREGVLVEVVSVVSAVEKEQMMVNFVKSELGAMLMDSHLDTNGNKHITKLEFQTLLMDHRAAKIISEIGVDVVGLVDYADFIFRNADELSFPDFMELVMQLRGQNFTTVKDMVDFRQFVSKLITDSQENYEKIVSKYTKSSEARIDMTVSRIGKRLDRVSTNVERLRSFRPVAPAASNVPTPVGTLVASAPHSPAPAMPMIPVVDEGEEMEC